MNHKEVHVLWACSLLIIPPPPPGSEALPGGFPDDFSQINLSDWASTVQDVAAGLLALLQGLSSCLLPEVVNLLLHLESVSQVGFCLHCYLPGASCRCLRASSLASLPSWSQVYCRTDSQLWDSSQLWCNDHPEYLLGRYVWIGTSTRATSTRDDIHLGLASP